MGKKYSEDKPQKAKEEKKYTRAQAEKALSQGMEPERFIKHANYHVRAKVWRKMGCPLPEDAAEREKFLKSIHQWKEPKVEEVPAVQETTAT